MQISIVQNGGDGGLEYIARAMDKLDIVILGSVSDILGDEELNDIYDTGLEPDDLFVFARAGTEITDELRKEIVEQIDDVDYVADPNYYY